MLTPILSKFSEIVKNQGKELIYQVLLVMIYGVPIDFDSAKQAVVELSSLPCSIIFVGVGSEDSD